MLELEVENEGKIVKLQFEHSLRSLSKWESKHKVAFMAGREKGPSEMLDYYQCMLLSPENPEMVYLLDPKQMDTLTEYINESQSASSVPQDWHLSRLMMLIQITSYKQQPPKKRNPREVLSDMRRENERRKKLLNTSG